MHTNLSVKTCPEIGEKHEGKRAGSRTKEQHSPSLFEDDKLHSKGHASFHQNRKSMLDLRQG